MGLVIKYKAVLGKVKILKLSKNNISRQKKLKMRNNCKFGTAFPMAGLIYHETQPLTKTIYIYDSDDFTNSLIINLLEPRSIPATKSVINNVTTIIYGPTALLASNQISVAERLQRKKNRYCFCFNSLIFMSKAKLNLASAKAIIQQAKVIKTPGGIDSNQDDSANQDYEKEVHLGGGLGRTPREIVLNQKLGVLSASTPSGNPCCQKQTFHIALYF